MTVIFELSESVTASLTGACNQFVYWKSLVFTITGVIALYSCLDYEGSDGGFSLVHWNLSHGSDAVL